LLNHIWRAQLRANGSPELLIGLLPDLFESMLKGRQPYRRAQALDQALRHSGVAVQSNLPSGFLLD